MVKYKIFLNPTFFGIGCQMFSENVYVNVFVYDAFDKLKVPPPPALPGAAVLPHTTTLPPPCFTI
jgi:hypothetical protein